MATPHRRSASVTLGFTPRTPRTNDSAASDWLPRYFGRLIESARTRWLSLHDAAAFMEHGAQRAIDIIYESLGDEVAPPFKPESGSLFVVDGSRLPSWRKDGYDYELFPLRTSSGTHVSVPFGKGGAPLLLGQSTDTLLVSFGEGAVEVEWARVAPRAGTGGQRENLDGDAAATEPQLQRRALRLSSADAGSTAGVWLVQYLADDHSPRYDTEGEPVILRHVAGQTPRGLAAPGPLLFSSPRGHSAPVERSLHQPSQPYSQRSPVSPEHTPGRGRATLSPQPSTSRYLGSTAPPASASPAGHALTSIGAGADEGERREPAPRPAGYGRSTAGLLYDAGLPPPAASSPLGSTTSRPLSLQYSIASLLPNVAEIMAALDESQAAEERVLQAAAGTGEEGQAGSSTSFGHPRWQQSEGRPAASGTSPLLLAGGRDYDDLFPEEEEGGRGGIVAAVSSVSAGPRPGAWGRVTDDAVYDDGDSDSSSEGGDMEVVGELRPVAPAAASAGSQLRFTRPVAELSREATAAATAATAAARVAGLAVGLTPVPATITSAATASATVPPPPDISSVLASISEAIAASKAASSAAAPAAPASGSLSDATAGARRRPPPPPPVVIAAPFPAAVKPLPPLLPSAARVPPASARSSAAAGGSASASYASLPAAAASPAAAPQPVLNIDLSDLLTPSPQLLHAHQRVQPLQQGTSAGSDSEVGGGLLFSDGGHSRSAPHTMGAVSAISSVASGSSGSPSQPHYTASFRPASSQALSVTPVPAAARILDMSAATNTHASGSRDSPAPAALTTDSPSSASPTYRDGGEVSALGDSVSHLFSSTGGSVAGLSSNQDYAQEEADNSSSSSLQHLPLSSPLAASTSPAPSPSSAARRTPAVEQDGGAREGSVVVDASSARRSPSSLLRGRDAAAISCDREYTLAPPVATAASPAASSRRPSAAAPHPSLLQRDASPLPDQTELGAGADRRVGYAALGDADAGWGRAPAPLSRSEGRSLQYALRPDASANAELAASRRSSTAGSGDGVAAPEAPAAAVAAAIFASVAAAPALFSPCGPELPSSSALSESHAYGQAAATHHDPPLGSPPYREVRPGGGDDASAPRGASHPRGSTAGSFIAGAEGEEDGGTETEALGLFARGSSDSDSVSDASGGGETGGVQRTAGPDRRVSAAAEPGLPSDQAQLAIQQAARRRREGGGGEAALGYAAQHREYLQQLQAEQAQGGVGGGYDEGGAVRGLGSPSGSSSSDGAGMGDYPGHYAGRGAGAGGSSPAAGRRLTGAAAASDYAVIDEGEGRAGADRQPWGVRHRHSRRANLSPHGSEHAYVEDLGPGPRRRRDSHGSPSRAVGRSGRREDGSSLGSHHRGSHAGRKAGVGASGAGDGHRDHGALRGTPHRFFDSAPPSATRRRTHAGRANDDEYDDVGGRRHTHGHYSPRRPQHESHRRSSRQGDHHNDGRGDEGEGHAAHSPSSSSYSPSQEALSPSGSDHQEPNRPRRHSSTTSDHRAGRGDRHDGGRQPRPSSSAAYYHGGLAPGGYAAPSLVPHGGRRSGTHSPSGRANSRAPRTSPGAGEPELASASNLTAEPLAAQLSQLLQNAVALAAMQQAQQQQQAQAQLLLRPAAAPALPMGMFPSHDGVPQYPSVPVFLPAAPAATGAYPPRPYPLPLSTAAYQPAWAAAPPRPSPPVPAPLPSAPAPLQAEATALLLSMTNRRRQRQQAGGGTPALPPPPQQHAPPAPSASADFSGPSSQPHYPGPLAPEQQRGLHFAPSPPRAPAVSEAQHHHHLPHHPHHHRPLNEPNAVLPAAGGDGEFPPHATRGDSRWHAEEPVRGHPQQQRPAAGWEDGGSSGERWDHGGGPGAVLSGPLLSQLSPCRDVEPFDGPESWGRRDDAQPTAPTVRALSPSPQRNRRGDRSGGAAVWEAGGGVVPAAAPASPPLPAIANRRLHPAALQGPPAPSGDAEDGAETRVSGEEGMEPALIGAAESAAHRAGAQQQPKGLRSGRGGNTAAPHMCGVVTLPPSDPRYRGFLTHLPGTPSPAATSLVSALRGWRVRRLLGCKKLAATAARVRDTRRLLAEEEAAGAAADGAFLAGLRSQVGTDVAELRRLFAPSASPGDPQAGVRAELSRILRPPGLLQQQQRRAGEAAALSEPPAAGADTAALQRRAAALASRKAVNARYSKAGAAAAAAAAAAVALSSDGPDGSDGAASAPANRPTLQARAVVQPPPSSPGSPPVSRKGSMAVVRGGEPPPPPASPARKGGAVAGGPEAEADSTAPLLAAVAAAASGPASAQWRLLLQVCRALQLPPTPATAGNGAAVGAPGSPVGRPPAPLTRSPSRTIIAAGAAGGGAAGPRGAGGPPLPGAASAAGAGGLRDTYAQAYLARHAPGPGPQTRVLGKRVSTPVCRGTLNPDWGGDSCLTLPLPPALSFVAAMVPTPEDPDPPAPAAWRPLSLHVDIVDADRFSAHTDCGGAALPLEQVWRLFRQQQKEEAGGGQAAPAAAWVPLKPAAGETPASLPPGANPSAAHPPRGACVLLRWLLVPPDEALLRERQESAAAAAATGGEATVAHVGANSSSGADSASSPRRHPANLRGAGSPFRGVPGSGYGQQQRGSPPPNSGPPFTADYERGVPEHGAPPGAPGGGAKPFLRRRVPSASPAVGGAAGPKEPAVDWTSVKPKTVSRHAPDAPSSAREDGGGGPTGGPARKRLVPMYKKPDFSRVGSKVSSNAAPPSSTGAAWDGAEAAERPRAGAGPKTVVRRLTLDALQLQQLEGEGPGAGSAPSGPGPAGALSGRRSEGGKPPAPRAQPPKASQQPPAAAAPGAKGQRELSSSELRKQWEKGLRGSGGAANPRSSLAKGKPPSTGDDASEADLPPPQQQQHFVRRGQQWEHAAGEVDPTGAVEYKPALGGHDAKDLWIQGSSASASAALPRHSSGGGRRNAAQSGLPLPSRTSTSTSIAGPLGYDPLASTVPTASGNAGSHAGRPGARDRSAGGPGLPRAASMSAVTPLSLEEAWRPGTAGHEATSTAPSSPTAPGPGSPRQTYSIRLPARSKVSPRPGGAAAPSEAGPADPYAAGLEAVLLSPARGHMATQQEEEPARQPFQLLQPLPGSAHESLGTSIEDYFLRAGRG